MHRLGALSIACVVAVLAACAALRDAEPPQVRLADLRLLQSGLFEQRLQVDLRVGNPNDFDLPLDGLTFELTLNDEPFAQGFTNEAVTIPRLGEATVPVVASTTLLDLVQQALVFGKRGDLSYRIEGVAYLQGPTRRSLPYERSGRLRLLPDTGPGDTLVPL